VARDEKRLEAGSYAEQARLGGDIVVRMWLHCGLKEFGSNVVTGGLAWFSSCLSAVEKGVPETSQVRCVRKFFRLPKESAQRRKSTSPRHYVDLAERLCEPRRETMRTSPRDYVNLAERLCEPRRETMRTSPRDYVNLAERLCEPRRETM
jgi:hypothetical protein